MIGNDIVDLHLAKTQSNWQRKGFLEKLFTPEEQKVVKNSDNPFLQVWLFWSMKEAAYKCYVQEYQKRFFAPLQFSCKTVSDADAIVEIKSKKYHIKYLNTEDYVFSIAQENSYQEMVSNVFLIDRNTTQTQFVNEKLMTSFPKGVQLKKNDLGIPYLYQNKKRLPVSVSTTHHGNYGAFAISYL